MAAFGYGIDIGQLPSQIDYRIAIGCCNVGLYAGRRYTDFYLLPQRLGNMPARSTDRIDRAMSMVPSLRTDRRQLRATYSWEPNTNSSACCVGAADISPLGGADHLTFSVYSCGTPFAAPCDIVSKPASLALFIPSTPSECVAVRAPQVRFSTARSSAAGMQCCPDSLL